MTKDELEGGTVHKMPDDLLRALTSDKSAKTLWKTLTPLARNEWICWTVTVKQQKTRDEHVKRVVSELKEGMRRPCCWIGCTHRKDKPISKSVQWVLNKQAKKKLVFKEQ
jgi:hypothetical protein